MITIKTRLKVADNSGAKTVSFIGVLGKKNSVVAGIGDIITCSVKTALPTGQVKKGEVVRAVVVRTHFPIKRTDGMTVKFEDNAAVIIDKQGNPRATRVFGPVAKEVKEKFAKIVSMAPEAI